MSVLKQFLPSKLPVTLIIHCLSNVEGLCPGTLWKVSALNTVIRSQVPSHMSGEDDK